MEETLVGVRCQTSRKLVFCRASSPLSFGTRLSLEHGGAIYEGTVEIPSLLIVAPLGGGVTARVLETLERGALERARETAPVPERADGPLSYLVICRADDAAVTADETVRAALLAPRADEEYA